MISLRALDTSRVQDAVNVALTALTAFAYIQFEPESYIPYDQKMAPLIRVVGYSILGLAAYEGWRTFLKWKQP